MHDGLHRLKTYDGGTLSGGSISGTPKREQDFTLDQLGNWSSLTDKTNGTIDFVDTRTHNDANELTAFMTPTTTIDPVHDAAGNMTEAPSPADPTVKHKYVFDAWNRLVKVTDASDVSIQENEFDGLNRRIVKIDKTGASDVTYDYYYNQQWQVAEIRKDGDAEPWKQYIYHPHYVDAVAVRYYDTDTDGTGIVSHYYLQDANYNVTAVTDNAGTVKERYSYTPYGEVTILDADFSADADNKSDIGNEYLYTGRRLDPETGLQLNRERYYASHLGRWVNRDPIGYGGGYNLYEYVSSAVTIMLDPEGLSPAAAPVWDHGPQWEPAPDPPPKPKPCPCYESSPPPLGKPTCDLFSVKLCRVIRYSMPVGGPLGIAGGARVKVHCDIPLEGGGGIGIFDRPTRAFNGFLCECTWKKMQLCKSTGNCGKPAGEETLKVGGVCGVTRGNLRPDPIAAGGFACNCKAPNAKPGESLCK